MGGILVKISKTVLESSEKKLENVMNILAKISGKRRGTSYKVLGEKIILK